MKNNYKKESGCFAPAVWILIILCIILFSCRTNKDSCGSYERWKAKHSFNK
jgi:hypothetical protein